MLSQYWPSQLDLSRQTQQRERLHAIHCQSNQIGLSAVKRCLWGGPMITVITSALAMIFVTHLCNGTASEERTEDKTTGTGNRACPLLQQHSTNSPTGRETGR